MTHNTTQNATEPNAAVLLVNLNGNDDKQRVLEEIDRKWTCLIAPTDWPESGYLDVQLGTVAVVLVFVHTYEEEEALRICEYLRGRRESDGIPLLVAINMYQMPLGNSVKCLPDAGFVFTPLKAGDLAVKIHEIAPKNTTATEPIDKEEKHASSAR